MRKRLRKSIAGILALLMVVGSFQLSGLQVKADEPTTTEDITYTMQEMGDSTLAWNVAEEDIADGGKKLAFEANSKSIFYAVPAELDNAEITKITFNVKSVSGINGAQNWWFGYKMFTDEGYQNDPGGNGIGEGDSMYGNPTREVPPDLEAPIKYLAITSAYEEITGPIDMEISGVTFTVKKTTPEGGSGNNQSGGDQTDSESEDITYTMEEIGDSTLAWNVAEEDIADGGKKLAFEANSKSIFYAVPAELDNAEITKITFNVKSVSGINGAQNWWFGYKMFTDEGYQNDPGGNGIGEGDSMYGNPTREVPPDLEAPIKYLAITSAYEEITGPIDMEISGITFTVKKATTPEGGSGNNQPGGDQTGGGSGNNQPGDDQTGGGSGNNQPGDDQTGGGSGNNQPGDDPTGGESGGNNNVPLGDGEHTFTMADITQADAWYVASENIEGGGKHLTFNGNWKTIFYEIPSNINFADVEKVTFNVTSGDVSKLAFKTLTKEAYDTEGRPQTQVQYGDPVLVPGKSTKADIKYLAITSNVSKDENDPTVVEIEISGITFTVKKSQGGGETNVVTYNFKDLEYANSYGVALKVSDGGELTAAYEKVNQETFYNLPENIDPNKVVNIELVVSSGNSVCIKLYPDANGAGESVTNYGVSYEPVAPFGSFGIMNLAGAGNTVKVSGVKITVEDALENIEINKTYTFNDLVADKNGGISATVDSATGSVTYSYTDHYQEVFYAIPKEIDMNKVHKVTFNVSSGNAGALAYKFYTATNYAGADNNNWPKAPESQLTYGEPVVELANGFEGIEYFGIMSMNAEEYTAVVDSVTFHTTGWGYSDVVEDTEDEYYETDDTQGDNLITNPNFADADLSMWGVAQGGSTITTGVSETPIFADVKTYGIISGRAENYEAFAQDLTGKVENGKEYSFSFFAKLSDDYVGAPASQRQITFGPYDVSGGKENYYNGTVKTLTAGKWTKVTGTFKVSSLSEIEKFVVRLLEQGENYGGGPGVKGEYYITGVSVKEIVKEKVEIEKDIPDWQSAIVKDLGEGTIAGTAVTYEEMADEALWELVTKHFNAITFGNELKLDAMIGGAKGATEHITFNGKDLEVPVLKLEEKQATQMLDKILAWNTANPNKKIKVRGHVLVWHSQAPEWFFKENYDANAAYVSKDVMDMRLEWYIKTILEFYTGPNSKYKDLFYGWDVVNEAIDDGTSTYRKVDGYVGDQKYHSAWAAVYGDQSNEYIIKAFQYANKYAPASLELYYNDYNDCTPSKVVGIVELLKAVKNAEGTRIDGMGMQAHHNMSSPSVEEVEAAVRAYCAVVGKVQWTELDIKASSAYDGTDATRAEEWNKMAHRYKAYYDVLKKLDAEDGIEVTGIIFWGVVDKYSWLQSSNSVGGASNGGNQCPLLFDDNYKAKPAFWAFVDPDRLTPEVKDIVITQKVDNTYPSGVEYSMEKGATKATVIPMWDTTGLKVLVKVQDATVDAVDAVTVYVDPAMKGGATTPVKATVKRADAKAVNGGYEAEVAVALSSVGALKEVSMDVVVVNGTERVAFNDTTFEQETSSKYYANALMKVGTTVQNGTIVVDGVVDAEWAEADAIPLAIGSVKAKPTFKVLWDKEYLYVLAEVQDSVLNKDNKDAWLQDSIEVFIDENNKKTAGYDGDDKQYRINYANELSFNGQKCIAENMKSATKVVDGGYVIEAAFKWTDIKPANGTNVGLELQLNDAESSTVRNKLSWADDADKGWESSRVFGTITLVGEPTLPELVEALDVLVDKNATKEEKIEAVKDVIAKVQEVVEAGNTEELTNEIVVKIEELFEEAIGRVLVVVNNDNKVPQIKKVIGAIIGIDLEYEAKMVFEAVTAPSLDAKYKNAFAFDAKLFAGDKAVQPLVPVTIRMEVPSSIDKNGKVAVLHYKDGATTPEKLAAKIVDGLLEFTTSSFSTFVVVNEVEGQSSDGSTGTTPDSNTGSNTGSSTGSSSGSSAPAATPAPSTDSGVKAPATGDSAYPAAVVAILLLTASTAVIMARKKKEEEEK